VAACRRGKGCETIDREARIGRMSVVSLSNSASADHAAQIGAGSTRGGEAAAADTCN
jgi:hypothetical protein